MQDFNAHSYNEFQMQDFIKKYRSILTFFGGLAVIAVIAFAFFYPDASEGNQLRQHDMQQGIAIGQEAKVYAEQTGEVSRWTNSLFSEIGRAHV